MKYVQPHVPDYVNILDGTRIKYVLTTKDILSVLILLYFGKFQYIQSVYGHFHRSGGSICFAKMAHYFIF